MWVSEVDELELDELTVPGDPSSAAFMAVAAALVHGSRVVIEDIGLNWTRTGFFRIAQRMGAVILGRPGGAERRAARRGAGGRARRGRRAR